MQTLTSEQKKSLIDIFIADTGFGLDYEGFIEVMLAMFENIPGFETETLVTANLLDELWRMYMVKNPAKQAEQPAEKLVETPKFIDLSTPLLQDAIKKGKTLIDAGKTKADAARLIYSMIKEEDKETIVAVFVEGATLTPKGALTYWYNCRRRAAKEAKKASEK